jgi:hypothetical protein
MYYKDKFANGDLHDAPAFRITNAGFEMACLNCGYGCYTILVGLVALSMVM